MPFATSADGTRIHYDVWEPRESAEQPDDPPVVLLQGIGLSSRFWFDFPSRIASDATRPRRAIALDTRGSGASDKPRGAYRMAQLAADVVAVLDAVGAPRAVIAGMSLGGMIAQHVAVRYPDRVHGLVLIATSPGLPHGTFPALRSLIKLAALGTRSTEREEALAYLLLPPKERHRVRELLAHWPAALAIDPTPPYAFLGQFAAGLTHSTGFSLPGVHCPAFVVAGADDTLMPPKNSVTLAKLLRRSHLEMLPEMGHDVPLLDPDVIARALRTIDKLAEAPVAPAREHGALRRMLGRWFRGRRLEFTT